MTPTAKELFYQNNKKEFWDNGTVEDYILPTMIEFAKLHVKQALKEASEKAEIETEYENPVNLSMGSFEIVDKSSILNSYPLTNIK